MKKSPSLVYIIAIAAIYLSSVSSSFAQAAPEWNPAWKQSREVVVQETAGLDRVHEPVEVEIQYRQPVRSGGLDAVEADIKKELRVVKSSPHGELAEVPGQAFDIRPAAASRTKKAENGKDITDIFVRVRVAFFADIPAYSTAKYYIYFDNPGAETPTYDTGLKVDGDGVAYTVDTPLYRIVTEKMSGQIDQIDLKFATKPSFRFKYGTLHWNPDFIVVPENFPVTGYTWYYAHHFEAPPCKTESGPVFFSMKRNQLIPGQETAYMEVYYRFYAGLPYFIMESLIEAKKDVKTFAIRNDELAFGRSDFTHAGWRNKTPDMFEDHMGEIGSINIFHETRAGAHVLGSALPPNMAWISLSNPEKGFGVGSVRISWENKNLLTGEPSPLYNSHTVISEHDEGLYWFRSLIYSPRSSAGVSSETVRANLVDVPKGSSYREKNAYMLYDFTEDGGFSPIDDLYFRLRKPLEVHVAGQ